MSLQTTCEHCGFTYVAKADMAGKKVRCRNCGQVFVVAAPGTEKAAKGTGVGAGAEQPQVDLGLPALDDLPNVPSAPSPYERNSDTTRVMPAIRTSESNMTGGVGSAKSMMERSGDPGTFDVAGGEAGPDVRPSRPFDFPFARELDKFGPTLMLWLLLLWTAYIAFAWKPWLEEQPYPAWAGLMPSALLLILYGIVWVPLFALAMRQVGKRLRFAIPPRHKSRAAALAALPFALGSVFWFAGESTGTMATGVILGIAIAAPVAWFLYRLRENEIPHAAIGLAAAGIFSTALTIGLYIGVNLLLNQTLIASGHFYTRDDKGQEIRLFVLSPLGPGMAWPTPEKPQVAAQNPPKPPTGGTPTSEIPIQQVSLKDIKAFSFDRPVDQVLFAPGRMDIVGAVTAGSAGGAGGAGQEVVRYKLSAPASLSKDIKWAKAEAMTEGAAPLGQGDACLAPDARSMARLVRFMGSVTVQVWSFDQGQVIKSYSPAEWRTGDTIQMLSFDGSSRVTCVRRLQGEFQPVTVDLDNLTATSWYRPAAGESGKLRPTSDSHGQMVVLSPDGTKVAVTAVMQDGSGYLRIYDEYGNIFSHELRIGKKEVMLDPTGLAFSLDGNQAAVAYEQKGTTSIFTCAATDNKPAELAVYLTGGIGNGDSGAKTEDSKPGDATPVRVRTNSLVWLAGNDQWLYGQKIADRRQQRFVGSIDLGQRVLQQTILDGKQWMALANTSSGPALLEATISPAAPATQP